MVVGLIEKGIPYPMPKKHQKKCWNCHHVTEFNGGGKACGYGRIGVKTVHQKDVACSKFLG